MVPAVRLGLLPLLLLLAGGRLFAAQTPTQSPPVQSPAVPAGFAQTTTPPIELPIDLARIKARVLTQKTLTLVDRDAMRIYVETVAPIPKFLDIVGDYNLRAGGVPGAGMTHAEFVQSTRPKAMYSSVGVTVGDAAKAMALNIVTTKVFELLRKGALALRQAKTDADRKTIQSRIDRELAALKGDII